ncbi:MAG: binding-protein-dependent transport systems inner membrane component, partial [Thermoanaerobacter thermocopriae]
MELIWEGLKGAFKFLFHGDPEIREITLLSLRIAAWAIGISSAIGLPLGIALGV